MFGARAAWFQKFLDWDKPTFGDMIDPEEVLYIKQEIFKRKRKKRIF